MRMGRIAANSIINSFVARAAGSEHSKCCLNTVGGNPTYTLLQKYGVVFR